jgi:hypothetical protein
MPLGKQEGITTSGREPDSNEPGAVETPDFLSYWQEQTGTHADALARNYQEPGGND